MTITAAYIRHWFKKNFEEAHPYCRVTFLANGVVLVEHLTENQKFIVTFEK